ncbi:kinase-like protein [Fistulina hepatica ATCC 64428]|uniref:Kinase-like protein n=1 Tax=Fistulina hepatica ATCC 64428 TaxID=1128425 RepID=A0A0D7AMY1_9AGAR|nr:kinase-like protein [Fistulina hepatica ATCC 64428]
MEREAQARLEEEQSQGWHRVKESVEKATKLTLDVIHDGLETSLPLLDLVPVPLVQSAAHTLLMIWSNLQSVDMNRLQCLRLTERCADILISIANEIEETADGHEISSVAEELKAPLERLVDSFKQVNAFLERQSHRPFLKRYLKRDEILKHIQSCDASLGDALGMFSLSIQIRTLKQVQESERRRQEDTKRILESMAASNRASAGQGQATTIPVPPSASSANALPSSSSVSTVVPSPSIPAATEIFNALRIKQSQVDQARDSADLRGLMRAALQTTSDAELIAVLQVGRDEMPEAIKTLQRALERLFDGTLGVESSSDSSVTLKDTLDREFMESGIDALRRLSRDQYPPGGLPSWTITRYEIDRDSRIGMGFFSDVYKGTWRGRTVAIKLLAETTPRGLFIREVEIWKTLKHRNVLELYGASSAVGSGPWFFVSPYLSNGSLVQYLRRLDLIMSPLKSPRVGMGMLRATLESSVRQSQGDNSVAPTLSVSTDSGNDPGDLLRFMHETAKGMEYLHSRGVLHGDLKAANVLVDDNFRCVISDFGQSEMRSEVYRLSNTLPSPHGTLRWQSPELMSGQSQRITNEMDIYAYAICCIEVLSMGRLPWPHQDDDNVRYLVLKNNARPPIPNTKYGSQGLTDLINACWDQNPFKRPSFSRIAKDVKMLRRNFGVVCESDAPTPLMAIQETFRAHPSPDMMPIPLPGSLSSYRTANESHASASPPSQTEYSMHMHREDTVQSSLYGGPDVYHVTEPVLYTSSSRPESSIFTETETSGEDSSLHAGVVAMDYEGYDSPPPLDERLAELRDERRYRILLSHEFHPSLTLPLWTPTHVLLGAVGYLLKPAGRFVSLFNAFNTEKSTDPDIMHWPSVYGYGTFKTGSYRHEKRSAAQRGLDAIVGFLTFKNRSGASSQNISRRYSYPMRAGHKMAILCTETTTYHYVDKLDAPKKWFMANVDAILAKFGPTHHIQKEDLYLIVGKLDAPNYALFVSHSHPDGQAHFNVFSSPRSGLPWGTFTTDTEVNGAYGGPSYQEPVAPVSSSKISTWGGPWDSVLLARLRFKPDVLEPTSL